MKIWEDYKPFRNYIRQFNYLQSLVDVWHYSSNLIEGQSLAPGYAAGMNVSITGPLTQHLYPWDLDILARELVLNASPNGLRTLKNWPELATAVNFIRRLDNEAYSNGGQKPPDVMFELHRIAHRQFPWQQKLGADGFLRAVQIFGEAAVERIVVRELGMTTTQYLLLGSAIAGRLQKQWAISTNQDFTTVGISLESSRSFFDRLCRSSDFLRKETLKHQSYDRDWLYAWNPLEATPLIRFDVEHPERVICPIPYHLLKRVTTGIFYDLVKSDDFDNPFGGAFQAYIATVARQGFLAPKFSVIEPRPYYVGSNKRHGTDLVISDLTGNLFLECKTKRLTLNARIRSDPEALNLDLTILAQAVVQNAQNIKDATENKTGWINNDLPTFSLILTLEEWYMFSPRVREMLVHRVNEVAREKGVSQEDVERAPFIVASAREFEVAVQVISKVSIGEFMRKKFAEGKGWWLLLPFMAHEFPEELAQVDWTHHANELRNFVERIRPA